MIRFSGTFLLFLFLFSIASCAGKPEESSEDAVVDLHQVSEDELQPETEAVDSVPEDPIPTDTAESPSIPTDPKKSEPESDLKNNSENPPETKIVAAKPAVESPISEEMPVPADSAAEPLPAPPDPLPPKIPVIPAVPEIDEKTASSTAPVPLAESPSKVDEPAPINPLLVADKPVEIAPEADSGPELEPESLPVTAQLPENEPEPDKSPEYPSVQLNDPAVSAASPSRILDEPGEFTITLGGLGWIFRSDLSSPGSWRFLERDLDGDSTHFRFMFTETGKWNLVFERQDLSSGGSESTVRNVLVKDGNALIDNGPLPEKSDNPISGNMPVDADSRNEAAEAAASEGRISEAMEFWEQNASGDDDAARRARAALVGNAAETGALGPLVTWLPAYLDDNPDPDTLASALDALERQGGYDPQSRSILEKLADIDNGPRRPEWLYRLASYLEKPGPERDLDRAAALYQEVISDFPLTEWREMSEERLLWLQRHYFRVR